MKIRWNTLLNFLALFSVLICVTGFQTTFWFQLFGNTPAPLLWLNLVVYVSLYRKPFPAILTIYAMGILLLTFTAMPLKIMWISLLILFTLVHLIKSRVFWSDSGYYIIMCIFSTITYHAISISISFFVDKNPVTFELFDRVLQIIITPSLALPMYWLLVRIDKATQNDLINESGGLEL